MCARMCVRVELKRKERNVQGQKTESLKSARQKRRLKGIKSYQHTHESSAQLIEAQVSWAALSSTSPCVPTTGAARSCYATGDKGKCTCVGVSLYRSKGIGGDHL